MKLKSTLQTAIRVLAGIMCFMSAGCVSAPEQSRDEADTFRSYHLE